MDWISVEDEFPKGYQILEVKLKSGEQKKCYFHEDEMSWLKFYGVKTSSFQDMKGEWLHDVTHWRGKGANR